MKKKKYRLLCVALAFTLLVAGFAITMSAGADDIEPIFDTGFAVTDTPINSTVEVGGGKATLGGENYDLTATVTYPDGRNAPANKFVADVAGEYKVTYSFALNGRTYEKTETFFVYRDGKSAFTADGCVLTNKAASPSYMTKKYSGLGVNPRSSGAKIAYNGLVDLGKADKTKPLIEFVFTPQKAGAEEIVLMKLVFTDVFDPTNTLTYYIRSGSTIAWPQFTLVSVYSSGQNYYADNVNSSLRVTPAGYNGVYGAEESFLPIALYYDSASKQALGYPHKWGTLDRTNLNLLNDLDDSAYSECANPWGGMGGGLAYASLEFVRTSSADASIIITEFAGQSFAEEKLPDENETVSIGINYLGYDPDALPKGVVGGKYPAFEALASSSVYGKTAVSGVIAIDPDGNVVPVTDGKFATAKAGIYTLAYTATSPSGKTAKKTVSVKVTSGYETPMSYEFGEKIVSRSNVFDPVYLYEGRASGGEGKLIAVNGIYDPSGNAVSLRNDGGTDYFVPEKTGEYRVEVTLTDFIGNSQKFTKTITVAAEKDVEIVSPVLPKAIRVGKTFTFPETIAKTYTTDGITTAPAELRINGSAAPRAFMPSGAGTVNVSYVYGAKSLDFTIEAREITHDETGFMAKYFYAENGSFGFDGEKLAFTSSATDSEWSFINPINSEQIALVFGLGGEYAGLSEIEFTITDASDKSNAIAIAVRRNADGYTLAANGGTVCGVHSPATAEFGFSIDGFTSALKAQDGSEIAVINRRTDGEPFTGFKGDAVYLTARIRTDGSETVKTTIARISSQAIDNADFDAAAPTVVMKDEPNTRNALKGETVTLGAAYGFDVFDLYDVTTTLKIVAPSGKTVYSGSCAEDVIFTAEEYGTYRATYSATDGSGNPNSFVRTVNVIEKTAPVLSFDGKYPTKAKVGATVKLAKVKVTDDSETKIYYLIKDGYGNIEVVASTEQTPVPSYKFDRAGTYEITVLCRDAFANEASIGYELTIG